MRIKKGKSLAFFSAKGGVGKTVNILNLAGIIEQIEKKVLVIDMDLYSGAIAASLNKKYDKSIYDLYEDLVNNRYDDIKDYVCMVDNYIDILPAPLDPRNSSKIEPRYIEDIIKKAELNYDVVLVDMNHALNEINLTTLNTVDQMLFFTTNDPVDLKNMKSLIAIFKDLEFTNFKVLLNNSRDPFKDYFSMYEIKKILKHNIDYTLSTDMFLKDLEKYIMDGVIISLDRKFSDIMTRDYQTFLVIATDLLDDKSGENNE